MLLDIALYIYLFGIVATSLYHLWGFSQGIKVLKSGSSAVFMGLQVLKEIACSFLWPILSIIFVLQMFFAKNTLDDFNESIDAYLYGDKDEREDE